MRALTNVKVGIEGTSLVSFSPSPSLPLVGPARSTLTCFNPVPAMLCTVTLSVPPRAIAQSGSWPAAVNMGPNPTFGEHALKVEVHLIDFAGSLYGQPLEVDFLAHLRSIQTFPSVEALKAQLSHDVAVARRIAESEGGS